MLKNLEEKCFDFSNLRKNAKFVSDFSFPKKVQKAFDEV